MGINIAHYKTVTFGISALYTGVAGALHAIIFEFVAPDSFRFELSIAFLVGVVVGGIASLPGAVIGGIFVQVIEKYADALDQARSTPAVHLPLDLEPWTIYGIVLIVLMYTDADGHRRRIGAAVAAAEGIVTARSSPAAMQVDFVTEQRRKST